MKQQIDSLDQLEMIGCTICLEEVEMGIELPGVGDLMAREIVQGENGIVGVSGGFPQMEIDKHDEKKLLYKIVALSPKAEEDFGLKLGDHILFSALVRFFTPVSVGQKDYLACNIEEGSVLAKIYPHEPPC